MARQVVERASNVPDAVIQKHIRLITGLRVSLDSAQGEYRAAVKKAKGEGVRTTQLLAAMADKKREIEDVHGDLKAYVRYLSLINMPIDQMELFGAKITEAAEAEAEGDEDHVRWEAEEVGMKAGHAGEKKEINPHPPGSLKHQAWHTGWMRGQEKLAREGKGKGGAKKASTRRTRASPGLLAN